MTDARDPIQDQIQAALQTRVAKIALAVLAMFLFVAIYAPFLANESFLIWIDESGWYFPALAETLNTRVYPEIYNVYFNCAAFILPIMVVWSLLRRRFQPWRMLRNLALLSIVAGTALQLPLIPGSDGMQALLRARPLTPHTHGSEQRLSRMEDEGVLEVARRGDFLKSVDGRVLEVLFTNISQGNVAVRERGVQNAQQEVLPAGDLKPLQKYFTLSAPIGHSYYKPYKEASLARPFTRDVVVNKLFIAGADDGGRDVMARMFFGARISLTIGFAATGLALLIGTMLGAISGYFGGRTDVLIQRCVEIMMMFPVFLLTLILVAMVGKELWIIILIFGLTGWPGTTRLIRGEFLVQMNREYVLAARALGLPHHRIMFRHILPNVSTPLLISATFGIASTVLGESGLAFLGLLNPETPSWGVLLNEARRNPTYIHLMYAPGLAIFALVASLNVLGNQLRVALDPREEL